MKLSRQARLALALIAALALVVALGIWYMTAMPGVRYRGPLQPLDISGQTLLANLRKHVVGVAFREHNVAHPEALERSASYIESTLASFGYIVVRQEFEAGGVKVRNLEVARKGSPFEGKPHLVVLGAHYDSALGAVGANDNGSGVAALLELARAATLIIPDPGIEIRIVFYVNEELPWFGTEKMGSFVHASGLKREGLDVSAMLSLETIGWYSDKPGSQRYPFPFNLLYPDTGDFIGFVGNLQSRELVRRMIGTFRRHEPFPSEGVVAPESIRGISWSDQWAYWNYGWPAVMVTDTAPYRYPYYHTSEDTSVQLNYDRLARVVRGLEGVVRELVIAPSSKD
jgi:Peptidase family M28